MAKQPVEGKKIFNPGFVMPIIDVIMIGTLLVAAGTHWYNTRGIEQIEQSKAELAEAREDIQNRRDELEQDLVDARARNLELEQKREAAGRKIVDLGESIQEEQMALQGLQRTDQMLTSTILDMNERIRAADEQRRIYQSNLLERDLEVQALREELAILRGDLADTLRRREAIERDIAALRRERTHDPISIFPIRASLSSGVEIADAANYYAVSLAGVLGRVGDLELGLSGGVGLAGDGRESVKEGAFFANIPLAFRRASLDLMGGVASMTDPTGEDEIGPVASAMLRYAPLRRERFFLEAGTKYRQEDLSVRLGLGFGRR